MMRESSLRWTDGVVLFDKPRGISSQKAVTIVKHACHANKAGHTGTLDPLATGLLAICLGEATKYSQDIFNSDKSYIATMQFGMKTDSGDSEGIVLATREYKGDSSDSAFRARLESLLPQFLGVIKQVPPMYSAIKRDGKPLYAYAREGEMFDLEAREVTIHYARWLQVGWPFAVLEVSCSKGTYIRSLIDDIGEELGCGAHMTELRRTKIGPLEIQDAQTEEQVKLSPNLLPVDSLITHVPTLLLGHPQALRLKMGQRIHLNDVPAMAEVATDANGIFKVYHLQQHSEQFMGLIEVKHGVIHPKRLMATDRLERVLSLSPESTLAVTDTSIPHHITNPIH